MALHPLAFEAMKQVLEEAGLEVVGWATSHEGAAELIAERAPGLLVFENDAPERWEFVRTARDLHARIKVIVVSSNDDQRLVDMRSRRALPPTV